MEGRYCVTLRVAGVCTLDGGHCVTSRVVSVYFGWWVLRDLEGCGSVYCGGWVLHDLEGSGSVFCIYGGFSVTLNPVYSRFNLDFKYIFSVYFKSIRLVID